MTEERGATMRVQRYEGPGRFVAARLPVPVRRPGEVLLRVRRVGICGTDLHIFQGHLDHRVPRGGVIGHETFGEVEEADASTGLARGARVVVNPVLSCGACRACRLGATYLCHDLRILGVDVDGGMREYHAVPGDRLLRVPDALDDDLAALLEPLAVAVHDVNRAGVARGQAVMVFGGGPIGALIALVCRERGARVLVAEVNPYRVTLLEEFGLEVVGPDGDPVTRAREWTGGDGVDVAFEVSSHPAAARAVTDVVRVWGTVSIVAIHAGPVPFDLYQLFAREITVHGSRLYTMDAWREAIGLAASGTLPLGRLVSRVIPLESLGEGMQAALAGGPVMKVLVDVSSAASRAA